MYYEGLSDAFTTEEVRNKTIEEIVELYKKECNNYLLNPEEIKKKGVTVLAPEEQERRKKLRERYNQVAFTKAARKRKAVLPATQNLRYPEDQIMRHVAPPGETFSKEDQAYNEKISTMFWHPGGHVSELIKLHRDMMRKVEDKYQFDRLLNRSLSDEELVENAEAVLDASTTLTQIQNTKVYLKGIHVLNEDGTVNNGEIINKNERGEEVSTKLSEEDRAYLEDYLRLCDKYEAYDFYTNDMASRLALIQNPHYDVIDYNQSQITDILPAITDIKEDTNRVYTENAVKDYYSCVMARYGYKQEISKGTVQDYLAEKGISTDEMRVKYSGKDKEFKYERVDKIDWFYRDGENGYIQIYKKDEPGNSLMLRADGSGNLVMQRSGAEKIQHVEPAEYEESLKVLKEGQPKKPERVPEAPKPGFFKRVLNTLFGAFKEECTAYKNYQNYQNNKETMDKQYQDQRDKYTAALKKVSDYNMAEYKKKVDAKNAERKKTVDARIKNIEAKKPVSNDTVNIEDRMERDIEVLAAGGQEEKEFQNTVLDLQACCAFERGNKMNVPTKEFNALKKQLDEQISKDNAVLKQSEVQKAACQYKENGAVRLRGHLLAGKISEQQRNNKELQGNASPFLNAKKTAEKHIAKGVAKL